MGHIVFLLLGLAHAQPDREPRLLLFSAETERFLLIEAPEPSWKMVDLRRDLRQASEADARVLARQARVYLGPRELLTAHPVRRMTYGTFGDQGLTLRIYFESGRELVYNFHFEYGRLFPQVINERPGFAILAFAEMFRRISFEPATLDQRLRVRRHTLDARSLDEICDDLLGAPTIITQDE